MPADQIRIYELYVRAPPPIKAIQGSTKTVYRRCLPSPSAATVSANEFENQRNKCSENNSFERTSPYRNVLSLNYSWGDGWREHGGVFVNSERKEGDRGNILSTNTTRVCVFNVVYGNSNLKYVCLLSLLNNRYTCMY